MQKKCLTPELPHPACKLRPHVQARRSTRRYSQCRPTASTPVTALVLDGIGMVPKYMVLGGGSRSAASSSLHSTPGAPPGTHPLGGQVDGRALQKQKRLCACEMERNPLRLTIGVTCVRGNRGARCGRTGSFKARTLSQATSKCCSKPSESSRQPLALRHRYHCCRRAHHEYRCLPLDAKALTLPVAKLRVEK